MIVGVIDTLLASSKHSLRSITLISNGSASLARSIRPLLEFPSISSLTVRNTFDHLRLDLGKDDFLAIVKAWPNLQ